MYINTNFDFRTDTPPGKDPDVYSLTLRSYHKFLWSKRLPNGTYFELTDTAQQAYLYHKSVAGEFYLSSDGAIPSFYRKRKCSEIISQFPTIKLDDFNRTCYTIGGMIVFPSNRIERKNTINGARGFHPRIQDRFDLTIECIRRHFYNEASPLSDVLNRYDDFFQLFTDFKGYVQHFLLQDIVSEDYKSVKFFIPFDNFIRTPLPEHIAEYTRYTELAAKFVNARGDRIHDYTTNELKK